MRFCLGRSHGKTVGGIEFGAIRFDRIHCRYSQSTEESARTALGIVATSVGRSPNDAFCRPGHSRICKAHFLLESEAPGRLGIGVVMGREPPGLEDRSLPSKVRHHAFNGVGNEHDLETEALGLVKCGQSETVTRIAPVT